MPCVLCVLCVLDLSSAQSPALPAPAPYITAIKQYLDKTMYPSLHSTAQPHNLSACLLGSGR